MKSTNLILILIIIVFSGICEARTYMNSDPCNAVLLENDVQACGSTTNATTTIPAVGLPCPTISANQIWYTVTIPANETNLEITLLASTLSGSAQVIIGQWTDGCTGTFQFEPGHNYCGPAIGIFEFSCLNPGTYHVLLSSNTSGAGEFCITARTYTSPAGCGLNDECGNTENISGLLIDGSPVCISGCNIGACRQDFTSSGCNSNKPVVWYSISIPVGAGTLSITFNSPDASLLNPQIQLFSGGCGALQAQSECLIGANGNLNALGLVVEGGRDYLIAVGNHSGTAGNFDLCVSIGGFQIACVLESEMIPLYTSQGSPLNGPYLAGEDVTFSYSFTFSSMGNNCQWPHSVVPIFGSCWDLSESELDDTGFRNWRWFPEGVVTYKTYNPFILSYTGADALQKLCYHLDPNCSGEPLFSGAELPAGWYHTNGGGPCANQDDPNNSWGENCNGCESSCIINFQFTLRAKSFEDCDTNPLSADCGVQIFVFSDRQTGCWSGGGDDTCLDDTPAYFYSSLNCCQGPEIDTMRTQICSGVTTEFEINSDQDDMIAGYEWEVSYFESGLLGATAGEGLVFSQNITNTSSQIREIDFKVTGKNLDGCRGPSSIFTFVVYPQFDPILHTVPEHLCGELSQDIFVQVAGGGGGPYTYEWDKPGIVDSFQLGVTYPDFGNYTYQVTVTDVSSGCQNSIVKEVYVGPGIEIDFNLLKLSYCYQENPVLLTAIPADGQWVSLTPGLLDEQNVFDLKQIAESGTYLFEYGLEDGPCIYRDTIGIFVNTSARDCPDTSVEAHTDGTEAPFTGIINTLPFLSNFAENSEVRIFDVLGKELYFSKNYQNEWNPEKYPAGLYFFIVTIDGKNYQQVISLIK